MPIGKNSIKRVKDGYSEIKTTAPDMENSTVLANPAPEIIEVLVPKAKPVAKKPAPKAPTKKYSPKKTVEKTTAPEEKNGFLRFGFGEELPIYLL